MHHPALTIAVVLFLAVAFLRERQRNRRLQEQRPGPDKAGSPVPSVGPLPTLPGAAGAEAEAERAYADAILAHAKTPRAVEITQPPDS